jgi:hypothetical protein
VALLSKLERDLLLNTREINKTQQRYIRYKLRKKIKQFYNVELPLLIEKGYVIGVAANTNGVAAGSHDGGAIKIGPISDINIMFESEAPNTERGSPSLVGRGIANPMSERTRGFEIPKMGRNSHSPRHFSS